MPQAFVTKNQRRGHELSGSSETIFLRVEKPKTSLMERAGFSNAKFYSRMKNRQALRWRNFGSCAT